jgi:hypothetical protein
LSRYDYQHAHTTITVPPLSSFSFHPCLKEFSCDTRAVWLEYRHNLFECGGYLGAGTRDHEHDCGGFPEHETVHGSFASFQLLPLIIHARFDVPVTGKGLTVISMF